MLLREPKTWRWTKKEYYEAADLGWFDGQRVELIDGEVVQMAPQKNPHAFALRLVSKAVGKAFGDAYTLLVQMPMDFGSSQPEPDLAVTRGAVRDVKQHPKSAVLVVEISDTTLAFDRGRKSALYASRGIREYWIVNLIDRTLEVRRRPTADADVPFGHKYTDVVVLRSGQSVSPLALRKSKIKVADLLP